MSKTISCKGRYCNRAEHFVLLEAQHILGDLRRERKQRTKREEIITTDLRLQQALQFQEIHLCGWKWGKKDNWLESFLASNVKDCRVMCSWINKNPLVIVGKKIRVLDKSVKKECLFYLTSCIACWNLCSLDCNLDLTLGNQLYPLHILLICMFIACQRSTELYGFQACCTSIVMSKRVVCFQHLM